MIARYLLMAWMITAVVAALALTIHLMGVAPVYDVDHCPDSDKFVCPATHIRPVPMAVNLAIAVGLVLPGAAVFSWHSRRST